MKRTIFLSSAVTAFALVLGLGGQTTPSQAATCDCVPVVSRCGAGKTCKFGGCSAPSAGSNVVGRCASTGGHSGKPNVDAPVTAAGGPKRVKATKQRRQP